MDRKIDNAGFYIGKIHRLSNRLMNHILSKRQMLDFNSEQGRILHALWQQDWQSQTELADMTGLTLNTLTKMLERMMAMKLVERCPHESDRRKKVICLTDHAKGLREEYQQISQEMTAIFYQGFSGQEIADFEGYLERILGNIAQAGKDEI
ncbi:Transcriptional regulator, MarR family [Streptococcus sp. DD11]|uniref:MarR family winged helix-turn-helix transcriptional regulator n=1 Tax=Streptococcus sp. DD11 TaxID=1777879 RepID=UPI0007931494|nr:MarR family winged helix-turn-helix transcriptional regulator [Streptococcus sp. DD11]KXT78325.1 Transcriptional regulator, MarR family [Streptococcus sp. DD11]